MSLLVRFWDYAEGSIRIADSELRTQTQTDIHNLITVLSQQTYLFNTSILENTRIAHPDATDAEIMNAARKSQLDGLSAMRL